MFRHFSAVSVLLLSTKCQSSVSFNPSRLTRVNLKRSYQTSIGIVGRGCGTNIISLLSVFLASLTSLYMISHEATCDDFDNIINNGGIDASNSLGIVNIIDQLCPGEGYVRVDGKVVNPEIKQFVENHALHDTLNGAGMIEAHRIFKKVDGDEIFCVFKFGKSINGYPGIVHGGITGTFKH